MGKCQWVASDQPRALPNGDPCPSMHCGTCGHRHVDQLTCPECVGQAREDIGAIVELTVKLLTEAVHKGVDSEAAMLEGAVADPNAWRQRRAYGYRDVTARNKRGDLVFPDRLGENAPLWVLGTWDLLVTEHYGHKRTQRVTVDRAAKYLAANLTELAQDADFAFEDLAREVRVCRAHLEAVLHDGEQVDPGAPCMTCDSALLRVWKDRDLPWSTSSTPVKARDDGWVCVRCRQISNDAQYRFAVRADYEGRGIAQADRLPVHDLAERIGVPASTVRRWASVRRVTTGPMIVDGVSVPGGTVEYPPLLRSCGRADSGRKLYRVEAAERLRDQLRGTVTA